MHGECGMFCTSISSWFGQVRDCTLLVLWYDFVLIVNVSSPNSQLFRVIVF